MGQTEPRLRAGERELTKDKERYDSWARLTKTVTWFCLLTKALSEFLKMWMWLMFFLWRVISLHTWPGLWVHHWLQPHFSNKTKCGMIPWLLLIEASLTYANTCRLLHQLFHSMCAWRWESALFWVGINRNTNHVSEYICDVFLDNLVLNSRQLVHSDSAEEPAFCSNNEWNIYCVGLSEILLQCFIFLWDFSIVNLIRFSLLMLTLKPIYNFYRV